MPTTQEMVTQIEAALKQRFFPLVPKIESPDRANWTEEQHDTNRLSRALAAYALVRLCDVDDATAVSSVTDGSNDGGIDSFYFDHSTKLLLVQSKFKRNGACPSQEENLKTINGIRELHARNFTGFNEAFQNRLDEIEEALDTPGVQLEMVVVFLGENVSPHVTNDLNGLKAEMNQGGNILDWHAYGLSSVYDWLVAEQTPVTVNAQVTIENWVSIDTPRKVIYGQIDARELARIAQDHGKALFERNIRHYLGSVSVNEAIRETILHQPTDLFYLNNGITAISENIVRAAGTRARCNFRLNGVSIVNGAQTVGTILDALTTHALPTDAKLLITIIETGTTHDDIGIRVTRARNYQNAVRGVDFAALDPNQERLRRELALVGITYYYRPSADARIRRDDAFNIEDAALALACLSFRVHHIRELGTVPPHTNAVNYVVAAKKQISQLWEQEGTYYRQLFTATLSGLRMYRLVRIYRFIDQILTSNEWSETSYYRRMFFRHGRYFIMAFVAHRSPEVISRPALTLSPEDVNVLSIRTNELAELIYAQSVPQQMFRGYLAIFRNLTDSQPLANGVLDRLALQDAAATPTPNPIINPQLPTEVQP